MPFSALGLLLIAACLHTAWNLLVKRASEKQIFTWWVLVVGMLCFSPLLIEVRSFPPTIWPYVLSSAGMEAVYYLVLLGAYQFGDFSLVYPIARGAAPAPDGGCRRVPSRRRRGCRSARRRRRARCRRRR